MVARRVAVTGAAGTRAERIAPWLVGGAFAAPVLIARYPPMGDLAFHEAMVAALRHFGDPTFAPRGLYTLNLGQPNQLFHLVAAALSLVVRTDLACKLVVAATVLAIVVAAARLAAHAGASRWAALVVAPIALGWTFQWGLVANLTGLAALLAALPSVDRLAEGPTPRRALVASAASVAVHLAHESSAVVLAGAVLLLAALRPLVARATALRVAPALVIGALVARYVVESDRLKAASIRAVPTSWVGVGSKITQLPGALFGGALDGVAALGVLALAVAAVALVRIGGGAGERATVRATLVRQRFALVGAACFLAYLAMPLALNGSTLVYHRFLAPAYALVVVGAFVGVSPRPVAAVAASAIPIAMLASVLPRFAESSGSYRALDALLPHIERASAIAQLDLSPRPPSVVAPIPGAAARAQAERGGRLLFSFTDAPAAPLSTSPAYQWNEPVLRLTYAPLAFAPSHDLRRFRYVVVRQTEPSAVGLVVGAFAPEARLVARSGEWLLFESTLDVAPLLSPDVALPSPPPDTIGARIARALRDRGRGGE